MDKRPGKIAARTKKDNVRTGAIIGDGDRKSWDPRAPMIWDNFSIFRTYHVQGKITES